MLLELFTFFSAFVFVVKFIFIGLAFERHGELKKPEKVNAYWYVITVCFWALLFYTLYTI